jgi:TetR/AcrR family transcriptional regulator, mexJK operon transcriptional repressor
MQKATEKPLARRGRRKDPEKRTAILRAAKRLFAQQGYTATSMDSIAQEAGVSKLTLYSHFRAKDELFQQAVIETCEEHAPPEFFDVRSTRPLRERLLQIGHGFLDLVMNDEVINVYRMMAAQARDGGKLGRLFYAAGPQRTLDQFSNLLKAAHRAGDLQVSDPLRAAAHFFCLLKGVYHLQLMMACAPRPGRAEIRAHVTDVVDVFLRAYRPGAAARS